MAFIIVESFSWPGTTTAVLATRYNTSAGAMSINLTGGRFGNGCLQITGNNVQQFNLRATIAPTIRIGVSIFSENWALTTATAQLIAILGDASAVQCYISVDPATKLVQARNGANTLLGTGTKTLQNNSWYYIEILVTINNATGSFSCSIDGASQFALTNVDTQNVATTNITGINLRGLSSGANTRYSDFWANDGGALQGESRVVLLTPTSDGAVSAWTPSTGTTLFNLVDEIPPNGDTDYISSATPTQQALFGFSNLPYTPATVFTVQVSLYARKDDAAARSIATLVRSGGTTVTGTTQVITSSYLDFYLQIYDLNPVSVAAWTPSEVDNMEAGVECVA